MKMRYVKCEDCGKTVCEVGATKQSCIIKAFWEKYDAEEESDSDSEEEQDCIDNDDHKMLECVECEECFPDYEDFKTKDNLHYCEACSLILENK